MKKLFLTYFFGLIIFNNNFLFSRDNNLSVYLECKAQGGPPISYGLLIGAEVSTVMVPNAEKKFDIVPLKTSPARYEFEYKTNFATISISIDRFSGEFTEVWKSGLKDESIFKGKCEQRDLEKPKF